MRNKFADTFYELASNNTKLCIVVADISPAGSMEKFRTEFPERFINTGVSEQIMIGMCAGMAQCGLQPFAYTIATFALYRPFEFIRNDLCYQNLPVTVVGIGGGLVYSTLGSTHHAQEDINIISTIPNISIISPCDPDEVESATRWCATQINGPVYLRLGKAGEPTLTKNSIDSWRFGKLRYIEKGKDICIISYGSIMNMAIKIADKLKQQNKSISVISAHTIKPLDKYGIINVLQNHKHIIVIEECSPYGSLGMRIKALAYEIKSSCKIDTFSLKDEFIHYYGNHADLLSKHNLSISYIIDNLRLNT